ncbi:Cna B-type domain-containing protein [Limosilactobacillus caecicola]|uniref:Cna B-type domain-containing protein n=1 Tax=Limosilactobacillus caecicola TaxID=2941332 RepID=UPI00203FC440|nr:Cna B-type domain-containing protein [Limosilactobacillus caecicola]
MITKTDPEGNKLSGATFELVNAAGEPVGEPQTTGADGTVTFTGLLYGTYPLKETAAPAGYTTAADQTVEVKPSQTNQSIAVTVTDSKEQPATTSATVSKVWDDNDNQDGLRPNSIAVNLLADGQVIKTMTLDAANDWAASFDDLPVYSDHGHKISYTVSEVNVPEGYTSAVVNNGNGFVITNTTPPTTTYFQKLPQTGNDRNALVVLGLMMMLSLGLIVVKFN